MDSVIVVKNFWKWRLILNERSAIGSFSTRGSKKTKKTSGKNREKTPVEKKARVNRSNPRNVGYNSSFGHRRFIRCKNLPPPLRPENVERAGLRGQRCDRNESAHGQRFTRIRHQPVLHCGGAGRAAHWSGTDDWGWDRKDNTGGITGGKYHVSRDRVK